MPYAHARYVTWARARHRHLQQGSAAAKDISPQLTTPVPPGGNYEAWASPTWESPDKTQKANFAFWSVTDSATGAWISFDENITVPVGETDTTALAWYLPEGTRGGGGPESC